MDENDTSKDLAAEGKKKERERLQPLRIHELLGIPKSSKNGNASIIQSERSQPVRIKDLFKSTPSCKKTYPSERRMTLANGKVTSARRQLYETSVRATPKNAFSTTAVLPESSETNAAELHGNTGSQAGSMSVQLGISKSEGKHVMNGPGFRQPERVKNLMESWEKSQTLKRQARKSVMGVLCATNVRRKLYNAPSPAVATQIAQKSLSPSRLHNQRNSIVVQRKSVKPDPKKSSQSQSRKSCLLPPNSIRDKHINLQQNDPIKEESPASLLNETEEKRWKRPKKTLPKNERHSRGKNIQIDEIVESGNSRPSPDEPEERSVSHDGEIDEAAPPRPTVIMAASSSRKISLDKNFNRSSRSSDGKKSPFVLSKPPFADLDRKSFPNRRLDAATSSIEDLLGNSRPEDCEPSIGNLPCNSFLEQLLTTKNSHVDIDRQTFRWMHANLKLMIQSTEENLFAMKKILHALDDFVDDDASVPEVLAPPRNEDAEIRNAARIEQEAVKKIDDPPKLPVVALERWVDDSEKIGEDSEIARSEPDNEENKENVFVEDFRVKLEKSGRRRSARLAAMEMAGSPKNSDDSFSAIERQLNIVHQKSKAATPRVATPRERKKIDPRSRRSMREYMALKSMVNCLQTPDAKGAPTPKGETAEIANQIRAKRSISRTLMNELDDLYADSPQ